MDESKLMSLIAEGEHEGLEFKRELHLERRVNKGEFVKDIISIANSAPDNIGHILVGIDNDKLIVGTNELEEERIQQIAHRYIRPPVTLRCSLESMQVAGLSLVGVIEIQGTEQPYRVTSSMGGLEQDSVFVRHGSVVTKATPEEIRRMHEESQRYGETMQLVQAAETHLRLGNFNEAINAYSGAIEKRPSAELFLARGKVYRCSISEAESSSDLKKKLANRALKDLSDAIELADPKELKQESRLERLRVCVMLDHYPETYYPKIWNQDLEWLKDNAESREHGETLYLEYAETDAASAFPNRAVAALGRAIELGYDEPDVYGLRATAYYNLHNYGLALQDIETALTGIKQKDKAAALLNFQAAIFVKLGQFRHAYASLSKARQLSKGEFKCWHSIVGEIESEILWRYSIAYEFGTLEKRQADTAKVVFQFLAASLTETEVLGIREERGKTIVDMSEVPVQFSKSYPEIAGVIERIIGKDFWRAYDEILRGERVLAWVSKSE